jgi:hypothetical protein
MSTAISRDRTLVAETPKPLTVTFAMAKQISGLGLTTLWALAKTGRIETVRVNRRTLITFRSLEALLTPSPTSAIKPPRHRGRPRKVLLAAEATA